MTPIEKVTLGKVYKDTITGFEGVAISQTEFLYACRRVGLQPKEMKDGKPIEPCYFDVYSLIEVSERTIPEAPENAKTGGPGFCPGPPSVEKRK